MGIKGQVKEFTTDWTGEDWAAATKAASQLVGGVSGMFGGAAQREGDAARAQQNEENALYLRKVQDYNRQASARANSFNFTGDLAQNQDMRATGLLGAMPLGQEQRFVQQQKLLGTTGANYANAPLPTAYGGVINPLAGLDLTPYGDMATSTSIGERRKALANVDPNLQFNAMSNYGLGAGAAEADRQVAEFARSRAAARTAREASMSAMLAQQMDAATALSLQPPPPDPAVEEQKGTPWWRKAIKIASIAAPFALAPFTGGLSLAAQGAIGAGLGVLGSAASGGSKRDHIMSAILGGIPAGGFAGGAKNVAGKVAGESAMSAIQRSILNPRALAPIASGGFSGDVGSALRAGSQFLPGNAGYQGAPAPTPSGQIFGDPTQPFHPNFSPGTMEGNLAKFLPNQITSGPFSPSAQAARYQAFTPAQIQAVGRGEAPTAPVVQGPAAEVVAETPATAVQQAIRPPATPNRIIANYDLPPNQQRIYDQAPANNPAFGSPPGHQEWLSMTRPDIAQLGQGVVPRTFGHIGDFYQQKAQDQASGAETSRLQQFTPEDNARIGKSLQVAGVIAGAGAAAGVTGASLLHFTPAMIAAARNLTTRRLGQPATTGPLDLSRGLGEEGLRIGKETFLKEFTQKILPRFAEYQKMSQSELSKFMLQYSNRHKYEEVMEMIQKASSMGWL